jgi:hypothetical protein
MSVSDINSQMIRQFSSSVSNFTEESVKANAAKSRQSSPGFSMDNLVRGAQANGTATQDDLKARPNFKRDAKMDAQIAAKPGAQDPAKGDLNNRPATTSTASKDTTGEAKQSEATSEAKEPAQTRKLSYAERLVQESQASRKKEADRQAADAAQNAQQEEAFQNAAQTGGGVEEVDYAA